jgi:hypothetical protein
MTGGLSFSLGFRITEEGKKAAGIYALRLTGFEN